MQKKHTKVQTESESRRPPSFLALEWIAKNTFCFWSVGGDGVEDVDQHQEQGDQERHPARDDVRWYNKTIRPGVLLLLSYQCFYLKVWEVCFCHK